MIDGKLCSKLSLFFNKNLKLQKINLYDERYIKESQNYFLKQNNNKHLFSF